jgi:flagellar biogenesis protein FliO
MARKREDRDGEAVPEHSHESEHEHKPRRGRKLVFLLAMVGGFAYVMRRKQQRAALDEGVWHEAPSA